MLWLHAHTGSLYADISFLPHVFFHIMGKLGELSENFLWVFVLKTIHLQKKVMSRLHWPVPPPVVVNGNDI